jgi:hypothetical protein
LSPGLTLARSIQLGSPSSWPCWRRRRSASSRRLLAFQTSTYTMYLTEHETAHCRQIESLLA